MDGGSKVLQRESGTESLTTLRSEQRVPAHSAARRVLPKDQGSDLRNDPIWVDAGLLLKAALCCIAVLAALALLLAYLRHVREFGIPELMLQAFLLDEEANIPTFFAVGLLVLCNVLLALIAARAFVARDGFRFHWALLAGLFALVAFDEAAMLHERLNAPTRGALGASGWMYFAWIIPMGGFVVMLALLYLPFLRSLPPRFGGLFILSAVLYVGGAVGMEMPGAAYFEVHGKHNFTYQSITIVEETLEMLGAALFAYALMGFIAQQHRKICVAFR